MSYTFTKEKDSLTAIINLLGENPDGGTSDGTNVSYRDGQTPPTEAEIDTELARLQEEYDAQEYARNREAYYPSLRDVTVALAEKAEGDSTMWDDITAKRAKVKSDHPKP